ncbi:MAG: twin-arginine translocation signal domain-containing protein [Haloferacaceae archaeon]
MTGDEPGRTTRRFESIVNRLRGGSGPSRREFLRRSAAAGAGTLALSVAGSNAALAHDAASDETSDAVLNYALTLEHLGTPSTATASSGSTTRTSGGPTRSAGSATASATRWCRTSRPSGTTRVPTPTS